MKTRLILIGLVVVLAFAAPRLVNGQCGYGAPYFAPALWGYGYQSSYANESVPYYSLHPPVYYSYRVARTYGYGPFAYPPGVMTPGSEPPRLGTVQNIYTTGGGAGETSESQQEHQPLRIDNPFVDQTKSGVTKDAKPAGRQPQVVYPTAVAYRTK